MARGWMPLYVGDFLADTMHLNAMETGIYIRFIMHCWQHGSIPDDPEKMRLIGRYSKFSQKSLCNVLAFFQRCEDKYPHHYTHRRVDKERSIFEQKSNNYKAAAVKRHTQSQSQSPKEKKDTHAAGAAPSAQEPPKKLVSRRKPYTPFPEGWLPKNFEPHLRHEFDRFRDHALQKDRRCADWDAAWRNWLSSPYQHRGQSNGHQEPKPGVVSVFKRMEEEFARRAGGEQREADILSLPARRLC